MSNRRRPRIETREVSDWREVQPSMALKAIVGTHVRVFQKDMAFGGFLTALVERHPGSGWHISISHKMQKTNQPGRYPTYEEIKEARYRFVPAEVTMAMIFPPPDEFVNVHDTTFHLYEAEPDSPDVVRWKKIAQEAQERVELWGTADA